MFPRNAWYVACTPDEIDGRPLGRTVCNQSLVFFRGPEGQAVALEDFCPHRGAPLSLGRVVEGRLVCGYHGLQVACSGRAESMPGQRVRSFPAVRSLPVVEKYGFVWLWPGDPQAADAALIPELTWADDPAWAYGGGLFNIGCDYRLMIDNLMDLTHETYVHATSIGQREIDETASTTRTNGDEVITERYMVGVQAPPFWQMALRSHRLPDDQPVDRWQICRFTPPSHVMIEVGVALAGRGGYQAPPSDKVSSIVVDFITPERDTSIWYFWGMTRNFRPEDRALTAQIREGQGKIFSEDREVLERQQQNLLRYPDRKLLKLNIDAGGVRARKVIDRRLAAEGVAPAAFASSAESSQLR